jgi:hypothetical protein
MNKVQNHGNPNITVTLSLSLKFRDSGCSITRLLCWLLFTIKLIQGATFLSNLHQVTDYRDREVFLNSSQCLQRN